ncbi:MAG: hypothetical protein K2X81_15790, partial [Candidatus Obscuribacterales bacterium]|nr:hypothetical protein [Candidatus Obscuribacterales bacterium]
MISSWNFSNVFSKRNPIGKVLPLSIGLVLGFSIARSVPGQAGEAQPTSLSESAKQGISVPVHKQEKATSKKDFDDLAERAFESGLLSSWVFEPWWRLDP